MSIHKVVIWFEYPDGTGWCEIYDRCGDVFSRCQDASSWALSERLSGMSKNQIVMKSAIEGFDSYMLKMESAKNKISMSDVLVGIEDKLVRDKLVRL